MLKDLANISNQVPVVKLCKEEYQKNSAEIERLVPTYFVSTT